MSSMTEVAERLRMGPIIKLSAGSGIEIACVDGNDTLRMTSSSDEPGVLTVTGLKPGRTYLLTHTAGAPPLWVSNDTVLHNEPKTVPRFHRHRWSTWSAGKGRRTGEPLRWVQIQIKTCVVCDLSRARAW